MATFKPEKIKLISNHISERTAAYLIDIFLCLIHQLTSSGTTLDQANSTAKQILASLKQAHRGDAYYIPKGTALSSLLKQYQIYKQLDGSNTRQVAAKFGVSIQWVYKIDRKMRNMVKSQQDGKLTIEECVREKSLSYLMGIFTHLEHLLTEQGISAEIAEQTATYTVEHIKEVHSGDYVLIPESRSLVDMLELHPAIAGLKEVSAEQVAEHLDRSLEWVQQISWAVEEISA